MNENEIRIQYDYKLGNIMKNHWEMLFVTCDPVNYIFKKWLKELYNNLIKCIIPKIERRYFTRLSL